MKSVLQDYDENPYCYVCEGNQRVEEHHCLFGKGQRTKSEKYGLKLRLCYQHHRSEKHGVHRGNVALKEELQQIAQHKFEETHTREEFREEFGLSYL